MTVRDRKFVEKDSIYVYNSVDYLPPASEFGMGVAQVGSRQAVSDGHKYVSRDAKIRIVDNLFPAQYRHLDNVLGTFTAPGTKTQVITESPYGVPNSTLLLESNAGGRAFISIATGDFTLVAGQWYAFSFDLLDKTAVLDSNSILTKTAGATIDRGSFGITHTQFNAGGVGRYGCIFMSVAGGTITTRLGVGVNSGAAGMMMKIANIMLEKIDISVTRAPSEYVYPKHQTIYSFSNGLTLDSNNKIISSTISQQPITKPYSHLLVVGDSRSDEVLDIGGALNTIMTAAGVGIANVHAEGGWATTSVIGPVNNADATYNKDVTLASAIAGTIARRSWSSAGQWELWDYRYAGASPIDTLVIADLGYNDINTAATPAIGLESAYTNMVIIIETAVSYGLNVVVTDNNPFSAYATYSTYKRDALLTLGDRLRKYCSENGHIFISIYDLLGDSTNADKLSDGAGTTPNYSADALHLSSGGSSAVATLINNTLNKYR